MGTTIDHTVKYKILVVDDEIDVGRALESMIVDAGFEPIFATSALEAAKLVEEHHRDIAAIFSDLRMPDEDGLELRAKLLAKFRDIPFIVISGFVTRELALQGVELKIAAFMDKPASERDFHAVLNREAALRVEQLRERQAIEATFFAEAQSIVEEVEPLILSLEDRPGDFDAINAIFRLVHTLKGSGGVLESEVFSKFVHRFEDMLTRMKNRELAVSSGVISAMLRGFDVIKAMLSSFAARDARAFVLDILLKELAIHEQGPAGPSPTGNGVDRTSKPEAVSTKAETIKVSTRVLDDFMELSGEITVIRNMVNKLVRAIEKTQPGNRDINLLADLLDEMHKINSTLQGRIDDLRKVPVATATRPLKRTVRDLSASLKKTVDLEIEGEDLRVDAAVSQVLSDSLIHLVRNSLDHGLESPEERRKAGKSESGKIKVSCGENHDQIVISVQDDGRGIDIARVKAKLLANGSLGKDDVEKLSKPQLLAKIFDPGFSTAATVSEVSGRGVGMDMVKSSVERLRGQIEVATELGSGTAFTLKLPIPKSVLIINSLLVTAAAETFAIPQEKIVRLLQIEESQCANLVVQLEGGLVLRSEVGLVPLVRLSEVLGLSDETAVYGAEMSVVLVKGEAGTYGLIVDAIVDGEEVVVKNIGKHLAAFDFYAGATFLGDGRVGLILNVDGVQRLARTSRADAAYLKSEEETAVIPPSRYLLFKLFHFGVFAVALEQVFRLEELPANKVRYSGDQPLVIYRNGLLPLYSLGGLLDFAEAQPRFDENIHVLVFNRNERLFGLVIAAFVDIIEVRANVDRTISDRPGLTGNIFIGDDIASVVDLTELLQHKKLIEINIDSAGEVKSPAVDTHSAAANVYQGEGWGIFE